MAWSSAAAFWEWTETFERASCSLCHRLQGLDSNLPSCFLSTLPRSAVLTVRLTPRRTSRLHYYDCAAYVNFLANYHRVFLINLPNSRRGFTMFSAGNSALCLSTFKPYTVGLQLSTVFVIGYSTDNSFD